MFHHKNIRLSPNSYLGCQSYFVTICCSGRRPIFSDPAACQWLTEILRSESAARNFAVHAYCVMPDHVHFLAEGICPSSSLLVLVKALKIKTSRAHAQMTEQPLWQKKFYDHIVRPHESIGSIAWYVWMNPVRKGLARVVGEYPFAGSFTQLSFQIAASSHFWCPPKVSKAPASEGGRYNP